MEPQLNRIEKKIDDMDRKLDNHLERIAKMESSSGWIKWVLAMIVSAIGTLYIAIAKLSE